MHQLIPAVPIPPGLTPGHKIFLEKIGQISRGVDEERGQMPRLRGHFCSFFLLTSE